MRVRTPELPQNYPWLNTNRPLSLKQLRGRIVILDFWTYCCINCLHILPNLKYLENKYQDSITIIGVHSAKFEHEKEVENIRQAILRYDIEHPVLVDSDFKVWQSYTVRAWPTIIVIDPEGYLVSCISGEGNFDILEELIKKLIQEHQQKGTTNFQQIDSILEKQQQSITPLAFPGKVLATATKLFIADTGHHRIIVSSLDGEVLNTIGTGEKGLTDGSFSTAQFFSPQGMTIDDKNQLLYVADTENHAIRKIDLQNQLVATIAGTGKQSRNLHPHCGLGVEVALNSPWDLQKVGEDLFIAMAGAHQIWQMQLQTGRVQTYAGIGAEACIDGVLISAFAQPSGITTNGQELFIADSEVSSIRAVGLQAPQVRTVCGSGDLFGFGDVDGIGTEVRLQHCLGVEYGSNTLWVADTYNHKIKQVNLRTGECVTLLGNGAGFKDSRGTNAAFCEPCGLSLIDSYLYIADPNNHAIRRVDLNTLTVSTVELTNLCAPNVCIPSHLSIGT